MKGILGKKLGMTRVIREDGSFVPVTLIECTPNTITQIKTTDKDGYQAVVLGFAPLKRPAKTKKFYIVREFRFDNASELEKGKTIDLSLFAAGDKISITGTTKGRGFQGVVKRFNFAGGPGSHGSHFHREPGSVGSRAKPGKIHLGKHLPGRMGGETQTRKSEIAYLDLEKNLVGIKGAVPGSINSYVSIKTLS